MVLTPARFGIKHLQFQKSGGWGLSINEAFLSNNKIRGELVCVVYSKTAQLLALMLRESAGKKRANMKADERPFSRLRCGFAVCKRLYYTTMKVCFFDDSREGLSGLRPVQGAQATLISPLSPQVLRSSAD